MHMRLIAVLAQRYPFGFRLGSDGLIGSPAAGLHHPPVLWSAGISAVFVMAFMPVNLPQSRLIVNAYFTELPVNYNTLHTFFKTMLSGFTFCRYSPPVTKI